MKKNLPYISIKGDTLQDLIEIEMILVMLGYDIFINLSTELVFTYKQHYSSFYIICYTDYAYAYYSHSGCYSPKRFKHTQLNEIIEYVENYKKIKP